MSPSLNDVLNLFPDEAACAAVLKARRWPGGFVCPGCGDTRHDELITRAYVFECRSCRRQTSLTAGTVMAKSRLPLRTWFIAAYLMATHSNGISARQLHRQIGVSYKTAWLLLHKLRRTMVNPARQKLRERIELDVVEVPFRTEKAFVLLEGKDPTRRALHIATAVEVHVREATVARKGKKKTARASATRSGRIRLQVLPGPPTLKTIQAFIDENVEPGTHVHCDGAAYFKNLQRVHVTQTPVRELSSSAFFPHVNRVAALLKRWGLGVFHGMRPHHITAYLEEFTYRFNRRFYKAHAFDGMLDRAMSFFPSDYWSLIGRENPQRVQRRQAAAIAARLGPPPGKTGATSGAAQPTAPIQSKRWRRTLGGYRNDDGRLSHETTLGCITAERNRRKIQRDLG